MFLDKTQKRLQLFDSNLVKTSNQELHILETKKAGSADLTVQIQNPSILFTKLEDKKLGYFINQCCADSVLFEYKNEKWVLHIFELKRSVERNAWDKIKTQFQGAIQNAYALAGVLGIEFDMKNIHVYTVYRNDKFNQQANPVKMREAMHEKKVVDEEYVTAKKEWNAESITLEVTEVYECLHTKIKLDVDTGMGVYVIA